jgi:molecular chaperone GrpE
VEALRRQLEQAQAESEERLGQVQRLRADHVNYRRRLEQERDEERRRASALLIIKLLPVLDDFERAMDTAGPDLSGLNWVQGIGHIARKLRGTLEAEGLTQIDALGQPFDPAQHEAVLREETDDEHVGRVLSVLQNGYRLQDRVIRPAMVKVGVSPPAADRTRIV